MLELEEVYVYIPHYERLGNLGYMFTLAVADGEVKHVTPPSDIDSILDRLGYPTAEWVHGYIEGLAHKAFKLPRH